jgi:methyl-accepting chemotaxis protein
MAKDREVQREEAVAGAPSWDTLSAQTVQAIQTVMEGLAADRGAPEHVRVLTAEQQQQLYRQRDAYFACVWARGAPADRVDLLHELERTGRLRGLPAGASGSLVHDRIALGAAHLRANARAKAECAGLWGAVSSLEAVVRADAMSVEERQRDRQLEELAREVADNIQATSSTMFLLAQATEQLEAAEQVIEAVRGSFLWDYGSYWTVAEASNALQLALSAGEYSERLLSAHQNASPQPGAGYLGRAWKRGDVTVVSVEQDSDPDPMREELERAGVQTLIALPIAISKRVIGVMGFAVRRKLEVSEARRDALRNVAILASSSFERIAQISEMRDVAASAQAVNRVLRRINLAGSGADALRGALDAVRDAFDWDYGACWVRSGNSAELALVDESGAASEQFRRATKVARYKREVGACGQAWHTRDLVVVDDLGAVADDPRAPAARAAGIRAGICFPVIARAEVVGVIEVWSKRSVQLSQLRLDALRSVGSAVSSTVERLEERDRFASSLNEFASELTDVSSGLRSTSAEQAASAQELASAVGEVTATLSELRETSSEALRNAEQVISKAEGAFQTSASGRESVAHAIASMRTIREQVGEIAERILQLNDQTSQIGNIIATVNEISAQSKLLALNAAIEAARAGEHGKGFGVVASEIRSLAEQSKEATSQVREILGEIQAGTNAAVVAAEEGTKKSESGMALADASGEKIQDLARSMEESSSSARLIANSARQQSAGIEQVAQALVSINNATTSTAAGLKQTEIATAQLVTLAERMATIVRGIAPSAALKRSSDAPANQNAAE